VHGAFAHQRQVNAVLPWCECAIPPSAQLPVPPPPRRGPPRRKIAASGNPPTAKTHTEPRKRTTTRPSATTRTVGPDHYGFQVAQIKPPYSTAVHHALRCEQTVFTQVPLVPRLGCQRAIFCGMHFSISGLPSIKRAKNEAARSSGSQRSPAYATQKRHPCRGIKYERGAFLYFTCKKSRPGCGYKPRPKKNPAPPDRHRNGIIEHFAMPPFPIACLHTGIDAPALETRWANVAPLPLQIA